MRWIACVLIFVIELLSIRVAMAQSVRDSLEKRLPETSGVERIETQRLLIDLLARTDPQDALAYAGDVFASPSENQSSHLEAEVLMGQATAYLSLGVVDSATVYLEKIVSLLDEPAEEDVAAELSLLWAEVHRHKGVVEQALQEYEQALDGFKNTANISKQAEALQGVGRVYYEVGDLDGALHSYAESLALFEASGDETGIGKVLLNAGLVYDVSGDFERALALYSDALEIHESSGDYVGAGMALCNIGIFYDLIGETDLAIGFHNRSRTLCEETGQNLCQANAESNVAAIKFVQGEYRPAIELLREALSIYRIHDDKAAQAGVLNSLGKAYTQTRDIDRALASYEEARQLYEEMEQDEGMASVQIDAGQLFRRQAHYEEAIEALEAGISLAEKIGSKSLLKKGYYELFLLHEGFGEYREALAAHKRFKAANDSLFNHENEAILAELQTQFKSQEQRLRIQVLEQERSNQQFMMFGLLCGLLILLAVAIFAYRLYRQKSAAHNDLSVIHRDLQKTQQQLIHSEKMASLGQLTAGVAHEIRNPLNFIINFSKLNVELAHELIEEIDEGKEEQVAAVADKFEALITDLSFNAQKVNEHSLRADGIVQSMLEHANATRQERVPTDINVFVDEIVELAFYGVNQTERACEIGVERMYDEKAGIYELAPQELGRVLVNLFDNAIYAVCEKKARTIGEYEPVITIETRRVNGRIILKLQDNGPGMPAEVKQKIFEPFYSTKPTGKGTGLGLSLAYDIVTMGYGGEMSVESEEGRGTTFEIVLPKNQ